jgi:hypothetical protein
MDTLDSSLIDSINKSTTFSKDSITSDTNIIIKDKSSKKPVGRPKLNLTKEEKYIKYNHNSVKWAKNHSEQLNEKNRIYFNKVVSSYKFLNYLVANNLIISNKYNTEINNLINNTIIPDNIDYL